MDPMPKPLNVHARRPKILHLSADYPDPINTAKTPVVARLIDLVGERYEHRVISLNRQNPSLSQFVGLLAGSYMTVPEKDLANFKGGFALNYFAPPRGVLHASILTSLADWIAHRLEKKNAVPDLVVGYKLTIEGIVAQAVAARLGIPYALVIQGNTDQKVLSARPDLVARFRAIFQEAACVFSFAPWARLAVVQRLGERSGPTMDLPCPTVQDTLRTPVEAGATVISVFHLRNHRIKNLSGLAAAMSEIARGNQQCRLQIYGGGSRKETARCAAIVANIPGMELMGPRSQEELRSIMNSAAVLVTPSRRESFGLVFIEALFAGLPIIYPKGASVDGYFDGLPFAIKVDARSTRQISEAICHAITHEKELKAALAKWQSAGGLSRFTHAEIARTYAKGLDAALARHPTQEVFHV